MRNGTITFGVMTSFLQLVGMIQHPILQLLNLVPGVIHATASIDRLDELGNMTSNAVHDNKCAERNDHQLGRASVSRMLLSAMRMAIK